MSRKDTREERSSSPSRWRAVVQGVPRGACSDVIGFDAYREGAERFRLRLDRQTSMLFVGAALILAVWVGIALLQVPATWRPRPAVEHEQPAEA
jgi:hypothetical protein